jgi:hypothetical protein
MNPLDRFSSCRASVQILCFVAACLLASIKPAIAQLIFADSFNYPDGTIVGAPGSPWVNNYQPTNEASVVSGRLFLTATKQESIRVNFPIVLGSGTLYSRLTVNFSSLPTGQGNYFAFFRVAGVDNLRCRIWASTNGAAPGRFRLGIATIGFQPTMIARDLYLGTNYTLVSRYDITNCHSALWIDPTDESDITDRAENILDAGASPMGHFGFLQTAFYEAGTGNYIGALTVDGLRVGRAFADVLPLLEFIYITNAPNGTMEMQAIGRAGTNYILQATTALPFTNWVNLGTNAAGSDGLFNVSDPNATGFPRRFYRLLKR